MNTNQFSAPALAAPAPTLSLGDIYFVLFRHKWKILLCTLAGLAGAYATYKLNPPPFQSSAKLFVRYVLAESKALGPGSPEAAAKSPDQQGETIMNSEVEILRSLDLARQVAESIGPEKVLGKYGGGKDVNAALSIIQGNLAVSIAPQSSVIHISLKHQDPELVQALLREMITRYLKLHLETHTASGMLNELITQEADQLRSRLSQTEDQLRKASNQAGIVSLEDARKALAEQMGGIRRELFSAEAELAQRTSVFDALSKRAPAAPGEPEAPLPVEVVNEYRNLSSQIELLQRREYDLLTQFTSESPAVKELRAQLEETEKTRRDLYEKYPRLVHVSTPNMPANVVEVVDPTVAATQITALQAKIKVLTNQLNEVRGELAKIDQMEGPIVELRRQRELQEANYRLYAASREQSRINETLGNGRVSNIITIQNPSPPFRDVAATKKTLGLIGVSGLLLGLGWAFLMELYLDRSIKRAVDIERALHVPLFISIPKLRRRQLKELKAAAPLALNGANGKNGANGTHATNGVNGHDRLHDLSVNGNAAATSAAASSLQPYHDTLRDRLINYFESINLTHKPKLVAFTSLAHDAGVSTTAAGVARSLSETGESNVLLVDMNVRRGVAQQFSKGKPVCGLDEMLEERNNAHVQENLYVVAENNPSDQLSRNMPQRFSKLVPKLKASDFDYIIFDMPPVSQISITPRLAGFMDMVLMVVESEKTDRDLVQRATSLLGESRAHVGVVLNKTKRYVPGRLHQDSLSNA